MDWTSLTSYVAPSRSGWTSWPSSGASSCFFAPPRGVPSSGGFGLEIVDWTSRAGRCGLDVVDSTSWTSSVAPCRFVESTSWTSYVAPCRSAGVVVQNTAPPEKLNLAAPPGKTILKRSAPPLKFDADFGISDWVVGLTQPREESGAPSYLLPDAPLDAKTLNPKP